MDIAWLQKRLTVSEAEAAHMVHTDRLGPDPVPFGFINDVWKELLDQMQEGDEMWEFRSDDVSWEHLFGCAGIALVRNGEVVDRIFTRMN